MKILKELAELFFLILNLQEFLDEEMK